MGGKQVKGRGALVFLLVLALTVVSCGKPSEKSKEGQATNPAAASTTEPVEAQPTPESMQPTPQPPTKQPTTQAQPTAGSEDTESPTVEATAAATPAPSQGDSTPATASIATQSSYRIHSTWQEGGPEAPVKTEWDTEFVAKPLAVHHKAGGDFRMEMVFIGQTLWTKIMDMPWRKVDMGEDQMSDWGSMLSQEPAPVDVEEQTPLDDSIQWLMGAPAVKLAEGSLTADGEETMNGVSCKRYAVDSVYSYKVTFQAPLSGTVTELTQGQIWVADEGGSPPFVVRAELLKTETTEVEDGGSSTTIEYFESNVTDINSTDIVIEPPE